MERRQQGAHSISARWLILAAIAFVTFVGDLPAQEPQSFDTLPRTVLALYDGGRETEPRDTRIHHYLELPLNHLGYRLKYHDVTAGMPPMIIEPDVALVVSWFDDLLENAVAYTQWASNVTTARGIPPKQVAFDEPGFELTGGSNTERESYLARLGLTLAGQEEYIGAFATVSQIDPSMVGREAEFGISNGLYAPLRSASDAQSFLGIVPNETATGGAIDLIVAGPTGGYVHSSAALTWDPRLGSALWIVDPFVFFEKVLGTEPRPVPDVTTLNGRRLYFSTISPEGWLTPLPARTFGEEQPLASEVVLDRFIAPHQDLPVTVAVLTGDFDPSLGGSRVEEGKKVAVAIFALPNVEIATSGESLIQDWPFFGTYDRDVEANRLKQLSKSAESEPRGLLPAAFKTLGGAFAERGHSTFDHTPNAPRKYVRDAFDLDREVRGAVENASALAPAGRNASVFLWSGNARPFGAALVAARQAGVAAIGGGGGIYNQTAPSVSGLASFAASVGDNLQVYNALSGDGAYTNYWTSETHSFHALKLTLDWTNSPRRLKPFQLAYAARSAVDFGSRRAIEWALDRAQSGEVIPVTTSAYISIVEGFQGFVARSVGELRWRIEGRGTLNTVRFDHASGLALDPQASIGSIGARRKGEALYVALDPTVTEPLIALREDRGPSGVIASADQLTLQSARWSIEDFRRDGTGACFVASGYGPGEMVWNGPPGGEIALRMEELGGEVLYWDTVKIRDDGRLDFALPAVPNIRVRISLSSDCEY